MTAYCNHVTNTDCVLRDQRVAGYRSSPVAAFTTTKRFDTPEEEADLART